MNQKLDLSLQGYGRAPYDQLFTRHKVPFTTYNYLSIMKYLTVMQVYLTAYRKKTAKSRKRAKSPDFIKRVVGIDRSIDYIDRLLFEEQKQVNFAKVASNELNDFAFRLTSQFVSNLKSLMGINKNIKVAKSDLVYNSVYRNRAQVPPSAPRTPAATAPIDTH